jgi:deoxyadenosine/deoxycytidine kinase
MSGRKSYIAVEGVIGAGKTSMARKMAERLGARLVLEEAEENPFLTEFYRDRKRFAFQTQLSFLVQRCGQARLISQQDMFRRVTISDYLFEKDKVFASVNLSERELTLYNKLAKVLSVDIPTPDLVVYLVARADVQLKRIKKRGRPFEKDIEKAYLQALSAAYNNFFFHYSAAPVIVVDTSDTDLERDAKAFEAILKLVRRHEGGTLYYRPTGDA